MRCPAPLLVPGRWDKGLGKSREPLPLKADPPKAHPGTQSTLPERRFLGPGRSGPVACTPVAKHFSSKEESVPVLNPHVPWQGEKAKFKGVLTGAVRSGVCSSCRSAGDPVTWPSPHLAAAGLPHLWSSYSFTLFGGGGLPCAPHLAGQSVWVLELDWPGFKAPMSQGGFPRWLSG